MTFQQLQYLLAIYQEGSVSKAAKKLFVSQPSVSICLNTLEDELGFSIFLRSQKGLVPTPEGKRAIEYAKRICTAHASLTNIHKQKRPVFRCAGAGHRPFNQAYSRLVAEYKDRNIRFTAQCFSPSATIQHLASCELDVGILYTVSTWVQEIQTQISQNGLSFEVIGSVPISIRLGNRHPLSQKSEILPIDLLGIPLIESPSREISNSIYRGIFPIDQENAIISVNGDMSIQLISRGLGYSVGIPLSDDTCNRYDIRNHPLDGYCHKVLVITNPSQPKKAETRRFIELLKEELEKDMA